MEREALQEGEGRMEGQGRVSTNSEVADGPGRSRRPLGVIALSLMSI